MKRIGEEEEAKEERRTKLMLTRVMMILQVMHLSSLTSFVFCLCIMEDLTICKLSFRQSQLQDQTKTSDYNYSQCGSAFDKSIPFLF